MFATEPIIQLFGLYLAFIYGTIYRQYQFLCTYSGRLTLLCSGLDHNPDHLCRGVPRTRRYRGPPIYQSWSR